ncbi:hypothetical protein NHX12_021437 [Muraenolepis orangiensis]|uniref:Palmitoyltransferase n=1 Tax=Muraenolepis orangiensis TaxID=630683 RepID=A0A9Q0EQ18_9TELE|nr:hypothetical protein NHX12_021437 [Muraenolepis orangiensis]
MKKKRANGRRSEADEALCCCEYINRLGERSHVGACCCDCEDLDEACDRWIKLEPQRQDSLDRLSAVVADRLRVPWPWGGARQLDLSVVPPLVLLPALLHLAALHFLLGLAVLTALPALVLWYYYVTHRKKGRTLFFLSLALFSLAYMYFLFVSEVLPRGGGIGIGPAQLAAVTAGVTLTVAAMLHTRRDPGVVVRRGSPVHSTVTPPRAGHCRICGVCVRRLDHHCVCFLLTLVLFLLSSSYGISLVLRAVCPGQSVLVALFYCPGVYDQYSDALCFTCAWYCSMVTAGVLHLLLVQVVNVSTNVTEREARLAARESATSAHTTALYSRGFRHNWAEFMTMGERETPSPAPAPV